MSTRVLPSNVHKKICGKYFIFLHSEDIEEYLKRPGIYALQKTMFFWFSLVAKNKTKQKHFCTLLQTLLRRLFLRKNSEKGNCAWVGTPRSFFYFKQKAGFLEVFIWNYIHNFPLQNRYSHTARKYVLASKIYFKINTYLNYCSRIFLKNQVY